MTTYNPVTDAEIASGQPVTTSLITRLRDNVLAIIQGDASAPRISNAALSTVPGQNTLVYPTAGTYSLVIPTGIVSIEVEAIGSGGVGAVVTSGGSCFGGGGGERRLHRIAVTPGETITLIVGAAAIAWSLGGATLVKRGATVLTQANPGAIGGAGGTGGTGGYGDPGGVGGWLDTSVAGGVWSYVPNGSAAGSSNVSNGCGGQWDGATMQKSPGVGRIVVRY
jgi:hypothetical protein